MADSRSVRYLDFEHRQTQRLDNYLLQFYKNVPRSLIYRIIRKGEVRVNGGRKKAHYRLHQGDRIRVPPLSAKEKPPVNIPKGFRDQVWDSVVAETPSLLVINKPSGVAAHGGTGVPYGCIEALNFDANPSRTFYLGHRLDRDTSGILLIAKDRETMRLLHDAFRANQIAKEYVGLVEGQWPEEITSISKPLSRYLLPNGERRVKVDEKGQSSLTECRTLEAFDGATLMEFKPQTGRTHQIRVHASHVGHPLYGDQKYAGEAVRNATQRLMLHALEVSLPTGESFSVKPSEEFERVCNQVKSAD